MNNGRDGGNVIHIIGGDEANNRDDKSVAITAAATPPPAPLPAWPLAAAATPPLAPLPLVRTVSYATVKPLNWGTRTCSRWEQSGYCHYGSKCFFAHGDAGGSGQLSGAVQRPSQKWKVPNKINRIYGDWIDDIE